LIETARLRLRPARETDLDDLHAVLSDARAMRYWERPAYDDVAQTQSFLGSLMKAPFEYIIEHQGRCLGKAGMWRPEEIGYILHPDFWRRGFAFEALQAILPDIQSRQPDLTRFIAEIDPRNIGSARLLDKLGFAHIRTEQQNFLYGGTEWCDTAYFEKPLPALTS
jgi:ribosomal-protein-alanine N-acetyltransferase